MFSWADKQKGFTIVELLIVVVVIAILAAITIVSYNGIQDRAKNSAAQSASSQAAKKLLLYAVDNADSFPADKTAFLAATNLAEATGQGAGVTQGSTYQYRVSSDRRAYCLTTTTGGISYRTSETSSTPVKGGCDGHGLDGTAAITNYFPDPKPTTAGSIAVWDGGNTPLTNTNVASSWSASGRANRLVFPSTITQPHGGPMPDLSNAYGPYIGQRYTFVMSIRLISGAAGIGSVSIDRNAIIGSLTVHATGGSNISAMNTGQTYKVYATFTADATAAAISNNMRMYVNISNKSASATIESADIDFYPGDYQPSRKWASGDTPGWVWTGIANSSASTGPAL